jgi:hypothetical protein
MQHVGFNEITVGGKAAVVPVLDMRARNLIAAFIGALSITAGLNVAAVRQQFAPDAIVRGERQLRSWCLGSLDFPVGACVAAWVKKQAEVCSPTQQQEP